MLVAYLSDLGFKPCPHDNSVFYMDVDGSMLLIYVDDLLVAGPTEAIVDNFFKRISEKFKITISPLRHFLGLDIYYDRERGVLELSLGHMIRNLIQKHGNFLPDANSKEGRRWTPMEMKLKKRGADEAALSSDFPYASLVGALIYIAVMARPDISFAINKCAQYMSDPSETHWRALIHILIYLRTFPDLVIRYSSNPTNITNSINMLCAYVDTDHAGCYDTGRSTTGYCVLMNGGLIAWGSKKQAAVAGSTPESEFMGMYKAKNVVLYLRFLKDFLEGRNDRQQYHIRFNDTDEHKQTRGEKRKSDHIESQPPTPLNVDNQAAIDFSHNPVEGSRLRHIRTSYLSVREEVTQYKTIIPIKVASAENYADGFTKALPRNPFLQQRSIWLQTPISR